MMLLKLCAIPLASDPIICMRRARSSRVVSLALSRSRNSRSMALATASPASRTTGSGKTLSHVRLQRVEPHDASHRPGRISGTQAQRADASGCEHVLHCAGRQGGDIGHGDDIAPGRAEPRGQCQRLIGPTRRVRRSVRGPCMHSDGVLIQHHIGAFHADRPAELAQHLLQPRVGFRRGAIDQPCRVLGYDMLECCSPS